ncbi:MAG TPA: hypothetical protein VGJ29_07525 [Vicinamibacterales bacterium]
MSKINVPRLLLGGLVAGVVLNALDYGINNFLLNEAWLRLAQARNVNLDIMGSNSALVTFIVSDLALGMLIVWVYAGIRPRFGANNYTAAAAALTIFGAEWLIVATFAGWLLSWEMFIQTAGLSLVSTLIAGLIGCAQYREQGDVGR